ncbi:MAG: glycosyltransferase [Cyclobacteriaceae bacterium]
MFGSVNLDLITGHPLILLFWLVTLLLIVQESVLAGAFIRAKRSRPRTGSRAAQPASVVIAARNELENLKQLLPMLYAQQHPAFEILVADDRSQDGTAEWLQKEMAKCPHLRTVRITEVPPSFNSKKLALTRAIEAARYDIILLTDADCRPYSDTWLAILSGSFQNGTSIVLGYSPYRKEHGLLNGFIRYETLLTAFQYLGFAILGRPYMGVGRNLAYRRDLFIDNGGFGEVKHVTGGDDDLLINRLATAGNTEVVTDRSSQMWSVPENSLRGFFRQKTRHLSAGKHYRLADKLFTGVFPFSIIVWWVLLPILFISSLGQENELTHVATGFLLRTIIHTLAMSVTFRALGDSFRWWLLPLYDLIFALYYAVTGVTALLTKRIRWRI